MENLKKSWLKAITGVSLVLGLILGVKAMDKKINGETLKIATTTVWFNAADSGSNTYITDEITSPTAPCDEIAGDLCAVQLDLQHVDSEVLQAFYDRMQDPLQTDPTLQEFLNAGATKTGDSFRP
ncbi:MULTISPECIES: hypothetical protein [Sphingobacterium]|uniref:hypothetical protein n=1 Tax=Sphingobacterium TaxID=28453 RepID=UPI0013DD3485|nr:MULTISPECIES: hypothetical protein [unclassified Sphingobacterium]